MHTQIASFEGEVVRITNSKRGFVTILVRLADDSYGITYTGEQFRNYPVWGQLRIGDVVQGLKWKNRQRRIIDADSPVHLA